MSRTQTHFEIVPGLPATTAVPTYAGLPLGSSHTVADVRGDVDWGALAAAPGPLILHATATHLPDAARTLIEHGLTDTTPCVGTANGTTCQQRSIETTLAGCSTRPRLRAVSPRARWPGRWCDDRQDGGQPREANWWESRALYGWTVLVPRTKDQAGEMSRSSSPTAPCPSRCRPSPSSRRVARRRWSAVKGLVDGRFQWVVFTSTNAVRACGRSSTSSVSMRGRSRVCGSPASARPPRIGSVRSASTPNWCLPVSRARRAARRVPAYDDIFDPVNRVLLPRADIATETLAEGLRERGWEIEDVTAYRTVRAARRRRRPAR